VSTAKYNGYGELNWEKQTNNATQGLITTNYTYNDASGMIDNINRNGQVTQYGYDTDKRLSTVEIAGQHKQSYTYGSYDRVTKLTEITGGTKTLEKQMSYDDFGRVARQTFPSGYYTENHYDDYGNLTEVTDMYDRLIYKATEANARGQLTKILKGATETVYGYNDTKGQLTSMVAANVVNYSYGYDAKNNLEYRGDNLIGQKEKFTYDTQNRLTNWDILNSATNAVLKQNSITYNATTGNITGKSDLNVPSAVTFNYEKTTNPHALTTISPKSDAISSDELAVTYTDFRKIKTLNENGKSYTITYGVDNQRRKSEYTASGSTTTRYYFGDYEEVIVGSNVRKIHYLSGAIYIQNNSSDSLLYTYADNQGSLIALTEEDGTIINKFAYDPWGKRRSATNWTLSATPPSVGWGAFNRGYTGHEHLDMFNIINMNGRVYDPLTAMFFSPDPFIQSRGEWKNYNRYSYCMNNPTRYTDPSGYKYCYIDMPAFDDNASNWMRAASGGGGKNSALKLWDAPHRGSISYNWENGKYYYANGDEASFQDALDKWRTSSDAKTYYGRDASTAYKSIRYGSEATNKSLANIRNIAKTMIADIQKTKNTLFMMVVSSNALTSLSKISTLLISEPALEMIGGYASIYILVLGFEGDTNHKGYTNNFYEERGNPFKEQNRYENEMKNQDQQPPKGLWWLIIGSGVWSLYDSWPKPEVSIPTKTVQPIFQPLPITPYNQYFMNLK
jgi:RHS repeat-associated protein